MQLKLNRLGHVLGIAVAGMAFLIGGTIVLLEPSPATAQDAQDPSSPDVHSDVGLPGTDRPLALAMMCGFTPEALAVAGCTAQDAAALLAQASSIGDVADTLWLRVADADALARAVRDLRSSMRKYGADETGRAELAALTQLANEATIRKRDAIAACRASLLESLALRIGADNASMAERYIRNASRRLPGAYCVLPMSDQAMDALESAFAHLDSDSAELTPAQTAAVAQAETSMHASLATQRLETLTPAIRAELNAHLSTSP